MALSGKGMEIQSILCTVCGEVAESINHLFCDCEVAIKFWEAILKWLATPYFRLLTPGDAFNWVDDCRGGNSRPNP